MAATRSHRYSSPPRLPSNHHPLTHHLRPGLPRYQDSSDSETSESDCSDQRSLADRHRRQRGHAKVFIEPGATRLSEREREIMAAHQTRKSSSGTVREVSRVHSSQRRHRAEQVEDDDVDVHIVKRHRSSKSNKDKSQPGLVRRSTTTGVAGRLKEERSYRDRESIRRSSDGRTPSRKKSERRPSTNDRMSIPTRNERYSAADDNAEDVGDKRRKPIFTRSATVREGSTISLFRPFLPRSKSSAQRVKDSPPAVTIRGEERSAQRPPPSLRGYVKERSNDRSPITFGSFLGSPLGSPKPLKLPKRAESVKSPAAAKKREPERLYDFLYPGRSFTKADTTGPRVECLTCMSDVSRARSVKLKCGHRMCNTCLRRIFNLSVTDPQHMPPKCCTADAIPLENVDKLFDTAFKKQWNRKYQEFMTKNRIYCPARRCGEWIKPSHMYTDTSGGANHGRKYGKCNNCKTKVCCLCNNKWHNSKECPNDLATQEFIKVAKKEGWQRCYNCKATVELAQGCNHMTCRCRAEFCMICGSQWKTCDCPWFNYDAVEADRLNHMNAPRVPGLFPAANANPARGYQEEIDRRREQERRDEELARRLQGIGFGGDNNIHQAFGNAVPHHLNREFIHRAQDILSGNHNPAQTEAAEDLLHEATNLHRIQPIPFRRPTVNNIPLRQPGLLRAHTVASRIHNNHPAVRASERVIPRRTDTTYNAEAVVHRPHSPTLVDPVALRTSQLAGITRGRTAEGRVDEWRRHVEGDGGGENTDLVPDGW